MHDFILRHALDAVKAIGYISRMATDPQPRCRYCHGPLPAQPRGRPRVKCDGVACARAHQREYRRAYTSVGEAIGSLADFARKGQGGTKP